MKQFYSYANDGDGRLINVSEALHGKIYYCPYCGAEMIPRQGKIRRWHFAHKSNLENCSYESYLHKIAKKKIKEIFDNNPVWIEFQQKVFCKAECPLLNEDKCNWTKTNRVNLRDYYDKCEEEIEIDGFRADLLISSSTDSNRPPILIEIWVKHKSRENKINSGYRIIEIKINSEKDLDNILETHTIKEVDMRLETMGNDTHSVTFYNFKSLYEDPSEEEQRQVYYWGIFPNGKIMDFRTQSCLQPMDENVRFYIISDKRMTFDWCVKKALEYDVKLNDCRYCKFHPTRIKSMSCKYMRNSWSRTPMIVNSDNCQSFSIMNTNYGEWQYFFDKFTENNGRYKIVDLGVIKEEKLSQ